MTHRSSSFSIGIDRVLRLLSPHGAPTGERGFPAGVDRQDLHQQGNQSILDMFRRVVNAANGGDPTPFQIEENLAVFGVVRWAEGNVIEFCRLIALKTEACDIPYYCRPGERQRDIFYYRLDADAKIGYLFTHPYPHVHAQAHAGPRYALNGWPSPNAVVDFLEHVYVALFHAEWREWARRVWTSHWPANHQAVAEERFDRIMRAAQESNYGVLSQFTVQLQQLKGLLRIRKDEIFPLRLAGDRRDLLAYPLP